MCGETSIPRDMCAGNTLPGETYITVTPVGHSKLQSSLYLGSLMPAIHAAKDS